MRTLINGNDTVVCFDFYVWKQEKNIIRFHHEPIMAESSFVKLWTNVQGSSASPIAKYSLDNNNSAVIDMSDYIRTYHNVTSIMVECEADNIITIPLSVVGLINPKNVLIPSNNMLSKIWEDVAGALGEDVSDLKIAPPSYALASISSNLQLVFECGYWDDNVWGVDGYQLSIKSVLKNGQTVFFSPSPRSFNLQENVSRYSVGANYFDDYFGTFNIKQLECGKQYAAVRWVSFTGQIRLHTWEVTKAKMATRDSIELLTIDGSYNTIKGREDGFVLRLDGLTAYDMWYYADIITSSKVEVSMDGYTWQQVEITTKDVTIPDGDAGKLNTLEINCNWRKYDAITL